MKTLFDELEGLENSNTSNVNAKNKVDLKIGTKGKASLTKEQIAFNRLTQRIQKLETSIESESVKIDRLINFYEKEVQPNKIKLAEVQIVLALALDELTNKHRLAKSIVEKVKETILYLCDKAFEFIDVTPESEALYDRWSDISYQDDLEQQKNNGKDMFFNFFGDKFGDSINKDDFDMDDPESMARFQKKMEQLFEDTKNDTSKTKKKTKKQEEKEELKKQEEAIQNKSIRSIYISLTKVLHPDTEVDEVLKKDKEELMKSVTAAYEQKDLSTLLRLEMEWVFKTTEHLEKLAEDKLKIYISVLKERVSELEMEKHMLYRNPRLENVFPYVSQTEKTAKNSINEEKDQLLNDCLDLDSNTSILKRLKSKSEINDFINEFHEDQCYGGDFFDFDDLFF